MHFEIERTIEEEEEEEEENCCALHNSWTVKLSNPRFAQEYNVHNGGFLLGSRVERASERATTPLFSLEQSQRVAAGRLRIRYLFDYWFFHI